MSINTKLNEALRLIRVFHNQSQKELSELTGIPKSHISLIETKTRKVTLDTVEKYSAAFKIPVSNIMFFSENSENAKLGKIKDKISSKIISLLQWIEEAAK